MIYEVLITLLSEDKISKLKTKSTIPRG